jgi:hypothetical protein
VTLWATVVAERLGYPPETALTLGRFVAGSSARAKARRLGISDEKQDAEEPRCYLATYTEIGITRMQAARCQQVAAVPAPVFDAILAAYARQRASVTTSGVLRAAARAEAAGHTPEDIRDVPLPTPADLIAMMKQVLRRPGRRARRL